jgi:hypothetical protein
VDSPTPTEVKVVKLVEEARAKAKRICTCGLPRKQAGGLAKARPVNLAALTVVRSAVILHHRGAGAW